MAQDQRIEFLFAAQVSGNEQIKKLTDSVDKLRKEMDAIKTANGGLVTSMGNFSKSVGNASSHVQAYRKHLDDQAKALRNHRIGTMQAGMQVNDFVTSVSTGASPIQAFNQQIGQVGYAMQMMGGKMGAVGAFLAGPWSIAVIGASMAVGFLVEKFMAADEAAQDVKFATFSMSDAQSILGNVMDITTGKITTQNAALIDLAKAQIIVAKLQAQTRAAQAKGAVANIAKREFQFGGGMGGGFSIQRRKVDARDVISKEVLSGKMTGEVAIKRLENLKDAGKLTTQQFIEAASAVANLGVEVENIKVFDNARKLLEGTGGRSLLKPDKKGAAAAAAAAKRLAAENKRIAKELEAAREKEANSIQSFMDKIGKVGMKEIPAYQRQIAELEKDFMELSKTGQAATIAPFKAAVESIEMNAYSDMLKADLKDADRIVKDALPDMGELAVSKEMTDIISRTEELNASFEEIGNTVSDAFKGMLTGAMSWKDGMRSLIGSVIDQLWKLFVVQQIVGFISNALGGATGTPKSFTPTTSVTPPSFFAKGTTYAPGGMAVVGERGPELVNLPKGSQVIPNHKMGGMMGGNFNISVDARGSNDPAAVRAQVQQGILEAAPAIIAAAESRTLAGIRRPRLGGVMQ